MDKHYFITGTDTGVGKTFVAAALLTLAGQAGMKTSGFKPVAAGADDTPAGLRNEDGLMLQQAINQTMPYSMINPFCLRAAIAPHIAAAEEGLVLTVDSLWQKWQEFSAQPSDFCLVEGAGGWRVPLNHQESFADFAMRLNFPVILVVDMRLGCINHARLTAEAIVGDGLPLAGWVANQVSPHPMSRYRENLVALTSMLSCELLGEVPYMGSAEMGTADFHNAACHLRLPNG